MESLKLFLAKIQQKARARDRLRSHIDALNQTQAIIEFQLDGTIVDANEKFLQLMGYERHEVVGKHHQIFIAPEEREGEEYKKFWQRLNSGQYHTGQYKRMAKHNREVWIQGSYSPILDRQGRPYKVIKHAVDITAQRLQAADMEGRLAAIDRALAVISFDLDGIILDANDNFLRALGYQREEVIGHHHRMFVDEATRESTAYRDFWARLRQGEYNAGLYHRIRKDGSNAWIQATYNPIFDMAGRPFKIIKYATDVTERTCAVQMLQSALGSLSETVPAIAGQAQSASHLANQACSSANAGGSMVNHLADTINDINTRAQGMTEIIGVIDSIAFQTNILAINAAVEAAHAGERGKGFGVVAQEVRMLAERSAQSAHEIRVMVQNAIDSLADGSHRARLAGDAMHAIVASALQVNERVGEIAKAADAQADDITLVNQAVEHLRANNAVSV